MPRNRVQNLKARYVVPVLGPPIAEGIVGVSDGRIVAVGTEPLAGPVEDLGQVALLPGLVDPHTHLEFSLLERPIGQPGGSFSQWLGLLVEQFRRPGSGLENPRPPSDGNLPPTDRSSEAVVGGAIQAESAGTGSLPLPSVEQGFPGGLVLPGSSLSRAELALRAGLAELIRSGATAVADIAQPGFPTGPWSQIGMKAIVFLELRGPTRCRAAQAMQQARQHVEAWLAVVSGNPLPASVSAPLPALPSAQPDSPPERENVGGLCTRPAFGWPASATEGRGEKEAGVGRAYALPTSPDERRGDLYPPGQEACMSCQNLWQLGLSPHAPYTVRPELLEASVALAEKYRLPMAMHLAESLEEIQFLQTGRGPLRTLLEDLGQWEAGLVEPPKRPLHYLRGLAQAERVLIIHGNYLDEEEWAFLAAHRERMAVVFCPRSHAHFAHRPYPLREMLSWGVRVILGTDSRASAPDVNMLAELRYAAARFPDLPPATILELATLESARALGWEEVGALVPGRRADLIAVALPEQIGQADPYELVFHSDLPVAAVWIAGQKVFSASADLS